MRRLQALLASHTASILSDARSWVHWPQAPEAFAIAVLIGWASLLYGFHHAGRPFGSLKAMAWTMAIIAATAIIAGILAAFVPHLPISIGIFIPAMLGRAALKEKEEGEELRAAHPQLAAIVTLGISYMLNRLTDQMNDDCASWCESRTDSLRSVGQNRVEDRVTSLRNFEDAAGVLRTKLARRLPDDLKTQVQDHYAAIAPAVRAAVRAQNLRSDRKLREEYNIAEEALFQLLRLAYNWKLAGINLTVASYSLRRPERGTALRTGVGDYI